jgi:hypothetical protein
MKQSTKAQLQAIISKMTFPQALSMANGLNADYEVASEILRPFPKSIFGLTPDDVKATVEFQTAKFAYELAFNNLRNFNGIYVKQFKVELAQLRDEKRTKQIAEYQEKLG